MDKNIINEIRILPSDKNTFPKESDFRYFIENIMITRGGKYYFPKTMMKCPKDTLVLFQYSGMIRAVGLLVDFGKENVIDERGEKYSGYYIFDMNTLVYLESPITKDMLKSVCPLFKSFNMTKQIIPLEYLDNILDLLNSTNSLWDYNDDDIISEIENSNSVGLEKQVLVKARINQGVFREKLLKKYSKCCLCGLSRKSLLIASHIKPWADSDFKEKLDVENGFLMCPNHDKLFDGGWISFDDYGKIIISSQLDSNDKTLMNIHDNMKIVLSEKNKTYLHFHRDNIFKK